MAKKADWVARNVAPWIAAVDSLDRWRRATGARRPDARTVADLRALLHTLAERGEAVRREMPVPADPLARAFTTPEAKAALDAWHARRGALMRLGVWRSLEALQREPADGAPAEPPLSALQAAMASTELRVPPGLAPAIQSAVNPKTRQFFGHSVREILEGLAGKHAGHAVWLERLRSARYDVATAAGAQAWSEAWTVGIAANYLDGLASLAGHDLAEAMKCVWSDKALRLHAVDKLQLLPARERHLHLDLWTDLVQAQVLDHRPGRFDEDEAPWHCVPLSVHDLNVREAGKGEDGHAIRIDRGIGIDLLHLPVFADRACLAWQALSAPAQAVHAHVEGNTIVVDVSELAPGQEANLQLVIRLAGQLGNGGAAKVRRKAGASRFAAPPSPFVPPVLDALQDDIYRRWAEREDGVARALAAVQLDWRDVTDSAPHRGAPPPAPPGGLGSAALWRAMSIDGRPPQWLHVALVALHGGKWRRCALVVHPAVVEGELHCALCLDEDDAAEAPGDEPPIGAAELRRALQDPARTHWVGSHAGLGACVLVGVELDGAGVSKRR